MHMHNYTASVAPVDANSKDHADGSGTDHPVGKKLYYSR